MGILSFFYRAFNTKHGVNKTAVIVQMQNAILTTAEKRTGYPLEQGIIDTIRQEKSLLMLEAISRMVEGTDPEKIFSELESLKK